MIYDLDLNIMDFMDIMDFVDYLLRIKVSRINMQTILFNWSFQINKKCQKISAIHVFMPNIPYINFLFFYKYTFLSIIYFSCIPYF